MDLHHLLLLLQMQNLPQSLLPLPLLPQFLHPLHTQALLQFLLLIPLLPQFTLLFPRVGVLPYVLTAPPPWLQLRADDQLYVLAPPGWGRE